MNFSTFPVVRGYSREQGITKLLDFQHSVVTPCRDYAQVRYPAGVAGLIDSVVGSSEVNSNLVALACIGAVAAADRGLHRVLFPNDDGMPLSFFALAGAERGYGKSRALKPFLAGFDAYTKRSKEAWERSSLRCEVVSDVRSQQAQALCKRMANKKDMGLVDEAVDLLLEARKRIPIPNLLCDDFTPAALCMHMDSHGYIARLSSEAAPLDVGAYRQLCKYWSGEAHSQERVSRPSSCAVDPFVVNVAFTQPRYFNEFVQNPDSKDMGLLARTFLLCPASCTQQPRPFRLVTKDTAGIVSKKLHSLLDFAFEHSPRNGEYHRNLTLCPEAVELWEQYALDCKREAQYPRYLYRDIGGWFSRAPEHALRVSAIFHLAGDGCHTCEIIDVKTLEGAIQFAEAGIEQARAAIIADASDQQIRCAHAICEWMFDHCVRIIENTLLKTDMRNKKFDAPIVDSALLWLEGHGAVRRIERRYEKKNGRPKGFDFENLLH